MPDQSKNFGPSMKRLIVLLVLCAILLSNFSNFSPVLASEPSQAPSDIAMPDDVKLALIDYSKSLSDDSFTGGNFSQSIIDLIQERKIFYKELFDKGLHSTLENLKTEFNFEEDVKVTSQEGGQYEIDIYEKVILHGKYNIASPEDHPLVQAGYWALTQTKDESVKAALEEYITSVKSDAAVSTSEGYDQENVVHHRLLAIRGGGIVQLTSDVFDDRSNDNPVGSDIVTWENGRFNRKKPDFSQWYEYKLHNTAVEDLGKALVDDYTKAFSGGSSQISSIEVISTESLPGTESIATSYSRSAAMDYINYYTRDGINPCETGSDVLISTIYWNATYNYIAGSIKCNDCADYVSQALYAGGIPQNATWYASLNSSDWVNVSHLYSWLVNEANIGFATTNLSSLIGGDLLFVPDQHSVMVVGQSPLRFSAHSNDRWKKVVEPGMGLTWGVIIVIG